MPKDEFAFTQHFISFVVVENLKTFISFQMTF